MREIVHVTETQEQIEDEGLVIDYDEIKAVNGNGRDHGGDAGRFLAKWGGNAQGWTAAQQAALIWQLCGREVKQLTSAQAVVGNKVIYRFQL